MIINSNKLLQCLNSAVWHGMLSLTLEETEVIMRKEQLTC